MITTLDRLPNLSLCNLGVMTGIRLASILRIILLASIRVNLIFV